MKIIYLKEMMVREIAMSAYFFWKALADMLGSEGAYPFDGQFVRSVYILKAVRLSRDIK